MELRGPSQTTAVEVFGVDDIVGYRRSPSDVLRLILFSLATVVLLALTRWAESTVLAFESDVVALFGGLNPSVERALNQMLSIAAGVVGLAVFVPPLLLKRYRLIGYIVVGNLATALLVARRDVVAGPGRVRGRCSRRSSTASVPPRNGSLNLWTLAQLTSSFVILAPFVGRRWRQAGMVILATLVLGRIVLVSGLPAEIFLVVAIGATVGVAVLLAFGRPNRRPTVAAMTRRARVERVDSRRARAVRARRARRPLVRRDRSPTATASWSRCSAPTSVRSISCIARTATCA